MHVAEQLSSCALTLSFRDRHDGVHMVCPACSAHASQLFSCHELAADWRELLVRRCYHVEEGQSQWQVP